MCATVLSEPRTNVSNTQYSVKWCTDTECSYCGEGVSNIFDPMVIACACKTRAVHASCLRHWLLVRPHAAPAKYHCEVCDALYLDGSVWFAGLMMGLGMLNIIGTWMRTVGCAVVSDDWDVKK